MAPASLQHGEEYDHRARRRAIGAPGDRRRLSGGRTSSGEASAVSTQRRQPAGAFAGGPGARIEILAPGVEQQVRCAVEPRIVAPGCASAGSSRLVEAHAVLCHRLLERQRPSLAGYVTMAGSTDRAIAAGCRGGQPRRRCG